METPETSKAPVLIPFVCPYCAGANGAHLITLSRTGGMDCAACGKWLRANDVMRAMHAPREAAPMRAREIQQSPTPAPAEDTLRGTGARVAPSRRDRITWPPTSATRAAAAAAAKRS